MGPLAAQVTRAPRAPSAPWALTLAAAACLASLPSSQARPGDAEPPVAVVGDAQVTKADLADFVYERWRDRWLEALDDLVDERLLVAEKDRLSLVVPAAALEAAVEAEVKARAAQVRERYGDAVDLEEAVRSQYGTDVATWRRDVLRPRLWVHLLLHRAVRLSARLREQVVCRAIVVADRETALRLREQVERGADFGLLALRESEDASRSGGGLLPPVARGDLALREVEDALFAAVPGATVGPLEVAVPGGPRFHLYQVTQRVEPWTGTPASLAPRLEADLASEPVGRGEYERWAARLRRTQGVRVFAPDGSPLLAPGGK